jgi:hypothetical protein
MVIGFEIGSSREGGGDVKTSMSIIARKSSVLKGGNFGNYLKIKR